MLVVLIKSQKNALEKYIIFFVLMLSSLLGGGPSKYQLYSLQKLCLYIKPIYMFIYIFTVRFVQFIQITVLNKKNQHAKYHIKLKRSTEKAKECNKFSFINEITFITTIWHHHIKGHTKLGYEKLTTLLH